MLSGWSFLARVFAVWAVLSAVALPLLAQEEYRKHSFLIGGGAGVPGRDLRDLMSTSFLLRFGYGYRFHRNFQADVGVEGTFGAAGVKIVQQSAIGDIRIHDYELFVPFGLQAILPVAHTRFEFHGGGGGTYIHYAEEASVPGITLNCPYGCSVDIACPACRSRGGWGYYGNAGVAVSVDRGKHVWLGLSTRFVKGTTSGEPLGTVPGFETKDQWLNTAVEVILRP